MTQNDSSNQPAPHISKPTCPLKSLDVLVGEWHTQFVFPADPSKILHGRTSFEWFEGGLFLIERSVAAKDSNVPTGIMLIGCDGDSSDTFLQHYFDSRGVSRQYKMTLSDGVWKLWRESPGFWQRFIGTLSGDTITGAWEKSADGSNWQHDFDLTYIRDSAAQSHIDGKC